MSYVKLERRPASWWRTRFQTIGSMIDHGWVVWSVCANCFLTMQVDLTVLKLTLGRARPCGIAIQRVGGCEGVTTFHGVPPETNACMPLVAEWPPEWKHAPAPPLPRLPPEQRRRPLADPRTPTGTVRFHAR